MIFRVYGEGRMILGEAEVRCAIGRGGLRPAAEKREGDGCTPIGCWPVRRVLWRRDRLPGPEPRFAPIAITPDSGWCDDPRHPDYNRLVGLPHPASAEALWREDHVYDVIVVLGHNDDPVVPWAGSAIFLHLARPDYAPTQGCVAIGLSDMIGFLARAVLGDTICVVGDPPAR